MRYFKIKIPGTFFHRIIFSARHKIFLTAAVFLLLAGLLNYYLFQPHIALFQLFRFHSPTIVFTRHSFMQYFLTGYFSDALWCAALLLVTVVLSELNYLLFRHKLFILLLPFATEAAQGFAVINGIFDWFDILTYLVTECIFFILFPSLISPQYEKQ